MKKENIYVQIDSFDEFEKFRKVLNSLGFKIWGGYGGTSFDKYLRFDYHKRLGVHSTKLGFEQITFGQLIDLLNEPKKLAVKVENEKEFKALMKYYDSLGYVWNGGDKPLSKESLPSYPNAIKFEDKFQHSTGKECADYQIIQFAEFAEEKGIKLPLFQDETGEDMYIDSPIVVVRGSDNDWVISGEYDNVGMEYKGGYDWNINPSDPTLAGKRKLFSNKQAALDWIEAQKPKEIKVQLFDECVFALVSKKEILFKWKNGATHSAYRITPSDIEEISKAIKDLEK